MAFDGVLLKAGTGASAVAFPMKYIEASSWDTTPDQREEIKAERDDNTRELIRVTAQGKKSVIHFKTRPNLTNTEKMEILNWFTTHESDSVERKIQLTFWNEETNDYDIGYFYRPNMKYPIKKIEGTNIIYDAFEFDLIEY